MFNTFMDLVPTVQLAKAMKIQLAPNPNNWNPDGKDEWFMLGSLHGWESVHEKANSQNAAFGVLSASQRCY